jgi:hypothetical protein
MSIGRGGISVIPISILIFIRIEGVPIVSDPRSLALVSDSPSGGRGRGRGPGPIRVLLLVPLPPRGHYFLGQAGQGQVRLPIVLRVGPPVSAPHDRTVRDKSVP